MAYANEFKYSIHISEQEGQYIDASIPPGLGGGPESPYITEAQMDDHVRSLANTFYFAAFQGGRAVSAWKGPIGGAQSIFYIAEPQ